jgi:hypothetical protein
VDEVMRNMQGTFDQAQIEQVHPLSVRVGVVEVETRNWRVSCEHDVIKKRRWLWLR